MAEEHRCHQAPRLCANNCGFFGSPAMQDLCSKCYRDLQIKERHSSDAKLAFNQTLIPSSSAAAPPSVSISLPVSPPSHVPDDEISAAAAAASQQQLPANRCSTCRRRVGLTGFKCRCGMTFCGSHRYPEQHSCGFDYKSMGRVQISKANPVVKAEKLEKI